MNLHVFVGGADLTAITLFRTEIKKDSTDAVSTAVLNFLNEGSGARYGTAQYNVDRYGFRPVEWSEVVLTDDGGTRQFAGYITNVQHLEESGDITRYVCTCSDYGILLDRTTVNQVYESATDEEIILDAFAGVDGVINVDSENIASLVPDMATFEAKDISLREMMERICELSGGEWRVAYNGNLLYYASGAVAAPFGLSNVPNGVTTFDHRMDSVTRDFSGAANRITVLGSLADGGTELSGIAQDAPSQTLYGMLSMTIVDRSLVDQNSVNLRANAELAQRANPINNGKVTTWKDGLDVGQTLNVQNSIYSISGNYIIRAIDIHFIRMGPALNEGGMECRAEYAVEFGQRLPDLISALRRLERSPKQPTSIPVAKVPPGSITGDNFASTIEPVQIVDALPSLPDPAYSANAIVLLKTDRKIYRRVGNGWTAYVPTIDLTGQIQELQLANEAVTSAKLAAAAVTETKIAPDSISTPKIIAGAVQAVSIAAGAVLTDKLAAAAVTTAKLAAGAVEADNIAANAITAGKLAADSVVAGTIAVGAIRAEDAAFETAAIQSADVNELHGNKIIALTITSGQLAADSVTATKIVAGSVSSDKLNAAEIRVGGGGGKPGKFGVFGSSGTQIGFIGVESGFDGLWSSRARFGGTGPSNAPVKIIDNAYDLEISGPSSTVKVSNTSFDPSFSTVGVNVYDAVNTTWHVSRGVVLYGGGMQIGAIARNPSISNLAEVVLYTPGTSTISFLASGLGTVRAGSRFEIGGTPGISQTYTAVDGKTIVTLGGIVTSMGAANVAKVTEQINLAKSPSGYVECYFVNGLLSGVAHH